MSTLTLRTRLAQTVACASLLAVHSVAEAAWPDDISLSSMPTYEGNRVLSTSTLSEAYTTLVRELGASIGSRALGPASTLGAGTEVSLTHQVGFISSRIPDGPSAWQRAHVDNDPSLVLWQPGIMVRKGLPFSLEVGMAGTWVGLSRQGTFGGWVRAALVEGYKPFPDVSVHGGYTGYIGNNELELGVARLGASLGSDFALGGQPGVRSVVLSPFVDVSLLWVSAAPILDDATQASIGAIPYGGRGDRGQVTPEKPLLMPQVSGGMQVVAGKMLLRIAGGYTPGTLATVDTAVGLTF
ncbi:MAG: hypothetical protein ACON5B_15550 [Myxococcota bacterium]